MKLESIILFVFILSINAVKGQIYSTNDYYTSTHHGNILEIPNSSDNTGNIIFTQTNYNNIDFSAYQGDIGFYESAPGVGWIWKFGTAANKSRLWTRYDLRLDAGGGDITTLNNFGIGVMIPSEKLDVAGNTQVTGFYTATHNGNIMEVPNSGDNTGNIIFTQTNYNNIDFSAYQGDIGFYESAPGEGWIWKFGTAANKSRLWTKHDMVLDAGGGEIYTYNKFGIGTTTTGSHKLAVEGSIGAREIKVEASGWSDFVFEKDYELPTLEEVDKHIKEKGHLPEIPSEAHVTENGINLGEMNAKLLQKIEELTLYLIEQNKEIKEMKKEISSLKRKLKPN